MNTLFFRLFALAIVLLTFSGCESELVQQCRDSTECDTAQSCLNGRCQNDAPPADTGLDAGPDASSGDCRVDPCADGLLCNATTGVCENCTLDEQCDEYAVCHATERVCTCRAGYARCGGQCVSQDSVASCGSQCQPCPDVENGEPMCVQQTCSARCDEGYFLCEQGCEGSPGTCVECLDNTHCTDPLAPVCNRGSCAGCASDLDCSDVEGNAVCDVSSGTCVECLLDRAEACGTFACHPQTQRCTTTPLKSRRSCESCRSDHECLDDHICAPMHFNGIPRESGYCLRIDNSRFGEPTDCEEPFFVLDFKESITTGELAIICGINETLTTCEAVLDYDSSCASHDDCGVPGLDDGLCDVIEFEGVRCTYPCDTSLEYSQCFEPFGCATNDGTQYCGAY